MAKFGKNYPALGKSNERERLLFLAALGLAFSLLVILVVVFQFRNPNSKGGYPDVAAINTETANDSVSTVTLIAPERPVAPGTKLSDVRFRKMFWPRTQVPEGAVLDVSELTDFYAKVKLDPDIPVQRRHLTRQPTNSVLSVTPGNRAVTIKVDSETAIEYHVLPGSRVDLVLTHNVGSELTSKVIVQNARVLSLGGMTATSDEGALAGASRANNIRTRMASATVTLDVNPKDALKIATAKQLGKLSLMMRAPEDIAPPKTDSVSAADVDGVSAGPARRKLGCEKRGRVKIAGKGE
ncbi:MAG: Flp pilus assembly protein CpaB, partial [Bdellovibrionales bacterium]|nr:Flp pilus assembly protein CpaB [Bdellovibrionales bacterium]